MTTHDFSCVRRLVVKIGTATLSREGKVNVPYIRDIATQVAELHREGRQVLLVSSGAIGMGAGPLRQNVPVVDLRLRQACAAVGQPLLLHEYHEAFAVRGLVTAQVLLTAEVLTQRQTYLNLRNTIETLLGLGVVPILNENDSVATDEIGTAFGDNDQLSALVASKIDADLLIMLSDVDALYDQDPRKSSDAAPIRVVEEITDALVQGAGGVGSAYAVGGMRTKLEAAKIASTAGCRMVLAQGSEPDVLRRIMAGEVLGTLFLPKTRLRNRARWILHSQAAGTIHVDAGALKALRQKKSLLPSGVTGVDGAFSPGAVVSVGDVAKAVTSLSAAELRQLAGKHSSQIRAELGPGRRDVVAVPEDIVFLDAGDAA